MKARQHESGDDGGNSMGEEVKTVVDVEAAVSMHVDEETGRRYSRNEATGHTQWLSDDDGVNEAPTEEQGEKKQESSKKQSFRKIVGDDNAVFFQNIETEETVWKVPKNGDLVDL